MEDIVALLRYGTNLVFAVAVVIICVFYLFWHRKLAELSRRLLMVGLFFSIHELSYFVKDPSDPSFGPFIFQLTEVIFILVLFYAFTYIISTNESLEKRLTEAEKLDSDMQKRLDKLAQIKREISE